MSCSLTGDDAVTQASDAARAFGEVQWLGEDELARLSIVIEELIANLYEHGGVSRGQEVRLELASEPEGIRVTIVDPGTPYEEEQERLFALLDELCDEGAEVEAVVCTHHHPDHVGAVEAVSARYGEPVRGHALTLDRLAPARRGAAIAEGDRVALGTAPDGSEGWHLEAFFTPGHDRGHLVFRESRYRAVIAGDMLSTVATIPACWANRSTRLRT